MFLPVAMPSTPALTLLDIPQNLAQTLQLCFTLPILCFMSFTVLKTINCISSKSDNCPYNNIIVSLTLLICVAKIFNTWLKVLIIILDTGATAPKKTIIIIMKHPKDEEEEDDNINTKKQESTSENQTTADEAEDPEETNTTAD